MLHHVVRRFFHGDHAAVCAFNQHIRAQRDMTAVIFTVTYFDPRDYLWVVHIRDGMAAVGSRQTKSSGGN